MNNDLISRSEAIAAVERREPLLVGDKLVSTDSFKNFLRNRPAVDAEPVRHGRWEVRDTFYDIDGNLCYYAKCSICGRFIQYRVCDAPEPYCHCGAKMDAEE